MAGFLGDDATWVIDAFDADLAHADPLVGTRIGVYRLTGVLGRGGMGTVYAARRADHAFEHAVALKLIRHDLDAQGQARFMAERQILARLQHPRVARLLDGGVAPDGRPYLVMERIEGQTLLAYCDAHRLGVRARLRLFLDVCEAVQYAHRNLIIHRDLKPSNILVADGAGATAQRDASGDGAPPPEAAIGRTGGPQVKLLDFGIAKALGDDEAQAVHTQTGHFVVTPAYAAPEQLAGADVTTATDVYALGLLLYELLTGRRPYADTQPAARLAAVEAGPPPPPSAVPTARAPGAAAARGTTPAALAATLRGDLDTIVVHALREEPGARYASAAALADDLARWLDARPIAARPPTLGYLARKFVARNRSLTAGLGAGLAALLLGLGLALWQAQVAAAERDRAALEAEKSAQVAAFMKGLFRASAPGTALGDTVTAAELLRRGWQRLPTELAGQPRLQQAMLNEIGAIMLEMGTYARADSVLQQARALHDTTGPPTPAYGATLHLLGRVRDLQGDYAAAEARFRAALAVRRATLGPRHGEVGNTLNQLASMLTYQSRYDEAAPVYDDALAVLRRAFGPEHAHVTSAMHNYAWMRRAQGALVAADSLYRHAHTLALKTLPPNHPDMLTTLNGLALVRKQRGMLADADSLYRRILAEQERILAPDHPSLGITHSNLGMLLRRQGRPDDAVRHVRRALAIWRARLGAEHPYVAVGLSNLGAMELDRGRLAAAEAALDEALRLHRARLPAQHPRLASTLVRVGRLRLEQGRPADALPPLQEAGAIHDARYPPGHAAHAEGRLVLGRALAALGRPADARAALAPAHAAHCATDAPTHCDALTEALKAGGD